MSDVVIRLDELKFAHVLLVAGRTLYRINENEDYRYQAADPQNVPLGRFNAAGSYCFYLALHPTAAALEVLSYKPDLETGVLHQYDLARDLKLLDLTRWQFPTPGAGPATRAPYSAEEVVVNQYVTCPRNDAFPWRQDGNHAIAAHARGLGVDGILYQTSVAHSINAPGAFFEEPRQLLNLALFVTPDEAATLLPHRGSEKHVINPAFRERYRAELAATESITRRILCGTFEETAMLAVGAVPFTDERRVRTLA